NAHNLLNGRVAARGAIVVEKDEKGKFCEINCVTREGRSLDDCTLAVFQKLKRRRVIASANSGPYRATQLVRKSMRGQLDNRA
ncbi:MAG: hypothetical protein HKN14_13370, partial [Marinicaulis sp.]|nr:hypothetical protein [Marinicaulis sp.]